MLLILTVLTLFLSSVYGQTCSAYQSSETQCVTSGAGACLWLTDATLPNNGLCRCASEVKLDIFFGVDTSGSIGWTDFQTEKFWLEGLVTQGVGEGAKIGFNMFSTYTNLSRSMQVWDINDLITYVRGIRWTGGWTNTPQLLREAQDDFTLHHDAERAKVLIIVTDGNPCLPQTQGGCPQSICQFETAIKSQDIRTIIIGVGAGLESLYVKCLTQTDDDFIPVATFSADDFASILGSLSEILCPISYEFKITEIKPEINEDCYRCDRFLEIYNSGIEFYADDITLNGVVEGTGTNTLITQGQYLVFYDAETGYDTTSQLPDGNGLVTCHLCDGSICDLAACSDTSTSSTEACECGNSVYIPCGSGLGCTGYTCCFDNTVTKTNWDQQIWDSAPTLIDEVVYDSNTWIVTDDGYAYELLSKGFDNDDGDNWAQSCSVFGTPGSDPAATCTPSCTASGCAANGATGAVCNTAGQCECDSVTGYYPSCTGGACYTCKLIPEVEDCEVQWRKNGTDKYGAYIWTDVDFDGNVTYQLTYYSQSQGGKTLTATTKGELLKRIDDYYRGNDTIGGYVQTVIQQCFDKYNSGDIVCENYYSDPTWCIVHTAIPTVSPTPAPTSSPTPEPTDNPTPSPTLECPIYYFTDSENTICDPNRCNCADNDKECCIEYDDSQTPQRKYHDSSTYCWIDPEFPDSKRDEKDKYSTTTEDERESGYILTKKTHFIDVTIEPAGYPCVMDVCWQMRFDEIDCAYSAKRRRRNLLQNNMGGSTTSAPTPKPTEKKDDEEVPCDVNDLESVGVAIKPLQGCLVINGSDDIKNAIIEFTVEDIGNDDAIFESRAIYGDIVMVNASSRCQPSCADGRAFPMTIPVWYNTIVAIPVVPGKEDPLPAWLWWLIAAMVVFLALLAFLVYKYWWKNKATGAALASTQGDLDAAIEEAEAGWGGNLGGNGAGFNPLATGFNPANGAPNGAPNGPMGNGGGGSNFVRPLHQKEVFRQDFGPQMGRMG